MRLIMLAIVLGFPLIDLYTTVRFARWTGIPVWAWLAVSAFVGISLLRSERTAFRANVVAAMHGGQPLLRGLLDSGRKVLAGVLFVLPGVLSAWLAAPVPRPPQPTRAIFKVSLEDAKTARSGASAPSRDPPTIAVEVVPRKRRREKVVEGICGFEEFIPCKLSA